MPSGADAEKTATQGPAYPRESLDGQKSFRVILEDILSGIETTDSFAIKFSLLTKTPISKMKHVVRRLPAPIWSGQGRSRAEHILALIEEAGGKGTIVEVGGSAPAPAAPAGVRGTGQGRERQAGVPLVRISHGRGRSAMRILHDGRQGRREDRACARARKTLERHIPEAPLLLRRRSGLRNHRYQASRAVALARLRL